MVNCTNIKSVVERGKSIQVTSIEMKRFIGCNIFMSSLGYPRMRCFGQKPLGYLLLVTLCLEIVFLIFVVF